MWSKTVQEMDLGESRTTGNNLGYIERYVKVHVNVIRMKFEMLRDQEITVGQMGRILYGTGRKLTGYVMEVVRISVVIWNLFTLPPNGRKANQPIPTLSIPCNQSSKHLSIYFLQLGIYTFFLTQII